MDPVSFSDLGFHAWLSVAVLVVAFGSLIGDRFSPDIALGSAVAVLLLGGVLTPAEALAGFSNSAVLTIAVLFIIAAALRSTGAIRWVASWVLGKPRGVIVAQTRLIGISGVVSSVINNTPVVAMLSGAIEQWCRRARVPASKMLIPLSYATILGGMCTLIGTSTNLIVAGMMQNYPGLPTLQMFDPAWVGVPAAILGMIYLLTIGRWLLPERQAAFDQARGTKEYVLEMLVDPHGHIAGQSVIDAGLRELAGAFLVEAQRDGRILPAVASDTVLAGGDRLVFVGTATGLRQLYRMHGLKRADGEIFEVSEEGDRHFVEVVLARRSPVTGDTLRNARFREQYGAVVVAINRRGKQLESKPGSVVLQSGDTLLLETTARFADQFSESYDFAMVNQIRETASIRTGKAILSLSILGMMILANVLLPVGIFLCASLAALAVLATRCISWREARRAVDYQLIVTIACALALGTALAETGVASAVAGALMALGGGDPFWTLVLVYVLTMLFTEVLTNNATAVLMFPIGLASAQHLGVSPMPFIIVVMMAASASFMTPIGYQTNLMVYAPGGYRFTDYFRVGAPLSLIVGLTVLGLTPFVWSF